MERAVKLLSQLDIGKLKEYNDVKRYILSQFRLSPRLFMEKFNIAVRQHDETAVLFASRLRTLLKYYLDSRKVSTFDELFSLLICDRIKSALAEDCLNYVMSVEGMADNGWIDCDKLADVIDMYYANRVNGRPSAEAIGANGKNGVRNFAGKRNGSAGKPVINEQVDSPRNSDRRVMRSTGGRETEAKCWHCQGPHLKRDCPRLTSVTNQATSRSTGTRPGGIGGSGRPIRLNQAVVTVADAGQAADGTDGTAQVQSAQCFVSCPVRGEGSDYSLRRSTGDLVDMPGQGSYVSSAAADCDISESRVLQDCVESLTYVDIMLKEVPGKVVRSLNDSGSQLTIVNKKVLQGHAYPVCGSVQIRGLLGAPATAELTYLTVTLADNPECSVRVVCC